MAYRRFVSDVISTRFYLGILLRILVIAIALASLIAGVITTDNILSPIVVVSFVASVASVILLFNYITKIVEYIQRTNEQLALLLFAIKEGEFQHAFPALEQNPDFRKLGQTLSSVMQQFHRISFEKESYLKLLQAVNENLLAGILIVDEQDKIVTMNPPAIDILGRPQGNSLKEIRELSPQVFPHLLELRSGDRKVISVVQQAMRNQFALQMKEVKVSGRVIRIFLLQNISFELEGGEIEAWQAMASVLTHEIMNSVTPISSLTASINQMLRKDDGTRKDWNELSQTQVDVIHESLQTIERRTDSLINFIKSYKEFSSIAQVNPVTVDVVEHLQSTIDFFCTQEQKDAISIKCDLMPNHRVRSIDEALFERVFINVIKNALESLRFTEHPQLRIEVSVYGNKMRIAFIDNGPGISAEVLPLIFVPFFTTKAGGSGVGLSLSRQILRLHSGRLAVNSSEGNGTSVILEF